MDLGPNSAGRVTWIFTLGDPTPDLMDLLESWTTDGGLAWVVIPIYNAEVTSLRPQMESFSAAR